MAIKDIFKKKKTQPRVEVPLSTDKDDSPNISPSDASPLMSAAGSSASSVYTSTINTNATATNLTKNPVFEQYTQLSRKPDFPQELTPIVTLLNCQAARVYIEGQVLHNVELNYSEEQEDDLFFQAVEATLRGTSILLSSQSVKPVTLDLLEATVHVQEQHNSVVLSTSHRAAHHLKFQDLRELQNWLAAIQLAVYEHTRLSQCYTASLLSAKATQLSDLHVVMGELKFAKEEWVSIKFSKNAQWIKCYMVVAPGNSKNLGSVNFYSSQKTTKRNLICSISTMDYCYAVYPSVVELIDNSALIKLQGDITLYTAGKNESPANTPVMSPRASHNRHASITSVASMMSSTSTKSVKGFPVHKTSLYILPQQHGGVKPYETMIRVLLPLYDAFKLYGRPKRLIPDKTSEESLLFGLPSLPRVKILTLKLARSLVADNWSLLCHDSAAFTQLFDVQLKNLYNTDPTFGGYGDLRESVQSASSFEHPFTRRMSMTSSSSEFTTPKYAISVSDLPVGLSTEALEEIQTSFTGVMKSTTSARVRSPSIGRPRGESRASQLRAESYSNLNSLMEGAHITENPAVAGA